MDWPRGWSVFLVTRVSAVITVLIKFTGVDQKQLECSAPPIPAQCDHSPERCNRCWRGYPQSRFPNWTEKQVRKAKIYNIVHNYSKIQPCVCYRVDVNDHGLFTHPREIKAVYGDEDRIWDSLINEQVSCIVILYVKHTLWEDSSFRDHPIHDCEPCSSKIYLDLYFRCWARSIHILPFVLRVLTEA